MNIVTYRFDVWKGDGTFLRSIPRDQSYLTRSGLRASLTPEGDCVEMTLKAMNGPLLGQAGFGLRNTNIVRWLGAETEHPMEAGWIPLWYGTLRVGGNPYDVDGENMTLRGFSRRLQELYVPPGTYPEADAGQVIRQLFRAVLYSGQLGTVNGFDLGGNPVGQLLVRYDPALIPDLGFTFKVQDRQAMPFGKLLDQVVADAKSKLNVNLAYGVRPDGRFFFGPADARELLIPLADRTKFALAPPVGETPCTAVLWTLGQDDTGTPLYYTSSNPAPAAQEAGSYLVWNTVDASLNPWAPAPAASQIVLNDGSGPVMAGEAVLAALTDLPDVNEVTVYGNTVTDTITAVLTVLQDVPRLTVELGISHYDASRDLVLFVPATGAAITLAPSGLRTDANGTIDLSYGARFSAVLYHVQAGSTLTVRATPDPTQTGDHGKRARMRLGSLRSEVPDAELLDGLAAYYYSLPPLAPADLESRTPVRPSELCGKIRTPLVQGPDYTENVATYEYRLTAGTGLTLGVMAGQPDDPNKLANADIIRRLNRQATVNAVLSR